MGKQTVLVLFGGVSNEYYVSRRTAASILREIDRERFEPIAVGITADGRWYLCDGKIEPILEDTWMQGAVPAILSPDRGVHGLTVFEAGGARNIHIDVIFPAVHGQHCEDGCLQGLMELSGVPYVGIGVTAAAVTFDKAITHIVAERAGIKMARWMLVLRGDDFADTERRVRETLGYPCFVKPANSGSSVGCSAARNAEELKAALALAGKEDRRIVVEELIVAQEVECAVMGNEELAAPRTGEIVSNDGFYDFDSKYLNDTARLYIPARISEEKSAEVQETAKRVYRALDCRGLSRVDFFVKKDGTVLFNEINTLPGFTSISMYPKMFIDAGMTYPEIITRLIGLALEENQK